MKDRIIAIIETLGLTQKKFADQIGITAGGLTDFIKGRSKDLSSSTVANIVVQYNVNPTWLLIGEGEMFTSSAISFTTERISEDELSYNERFDRETMESVIRIVTGMLRKEGLEMEPDKFAKFILFMYDRHKGMNGGITEKEIKDNIVMLKKFA